MAEAASNNFQVSATGGAGSAGQPAQYMAGGAYGEGKENMEIQTSAKMNKSGTVVRPTPGAQLRAGGSPVIPLSAPTQQPDVAPSQGAALGPGAGPNVLASNIMLDAQNNEDIAKLAAFLPVYAQIAESPNATNATRNFYRYLRTIVS
jgi:hypothetical protein